MNAKKVKAFRRIVRSMIKSGSQQLVKTAMATADEFDMTEKQVVRAFTVALKGV